MCRMAINLVLLSFSISAGAQVSFAVIAEPKLKSGDVPLRVSYKSNLTLRNTGQSLSIQTVAPLGDVSSLYSMVGFLIPYSVGFEIINTATGLRDNRIQLSNQTSLTGVSGSMFFPAGADHSWQIQVVGGGGSQGGANYTLYFRGYDNICSISNGVSFGAPQCIVYQLPVKSFAINWLPASTSPPATLRGIYPMINNRPNDSDPPAILPTSTFLSCNTASGCQ